MERSGNLRFLEYPAEDTYSVDWLRVPLRTMREGISSVDNALSTSSNLREWNRRGILTSTYGT